MVSREPDVRAPDDRLADALALLRDDPLGYVMFAFPWDSAPEIQIVELAQGVEASLSPGDRKRQAAYRARFPGCKYGPDLWACDFLEDFGRIIKDRAFDGRSPVMPIRFSTVSGHEIGKSALCAWLIKFILDTRSFSKGTVTAVTDEQLRTKTWAELGKWHGLSITAHWFNYTSARGSMTLAHADGRYGGSWRCDARTSRREKSEAFAGQHAPTATSFYIFDEASGIANELFDVREGGLSSGEPMVFDFGNGTQNSGAFYDHCEGRDKRYNTRSIDSRTVAITNKEKIAEDIETAKDGEDDDFVRVRWRGLFPARGSIQLIGVEAVEAAMERPPVDASGYAVTIGVDVARFGDDKTIIYPVRGYDARSFMPRALSKVPTTETTEQVAAVFNEFCSLGCRPAMIYVDEGGVGGGVVDQLRQKGFPVTGVHFGGRPLDGKKYRFKVDEIWCNVRDALPRLALPPAGTVEGDALKEDLTARQYRFTIKDQISLESKSDMKDRGLRSPDWADALAVNFAGEIAPLEKPGQVYDGGNTNWDYDPHERP